jgi:hypothetical protein
MHAEFLACDAPSTVQAMDVSSSRVSASGQTAHGQKLSFVGFSPVANKRGSGRIVRYAPLATKMMQHRE